MLDRVKMVKRKMDESLDQLCDVSWMFSKLPEKDFTRERKLPFRYLSCPFYRKSASGDGCTRSLMLLYHSHCH